MDNSSRRNTWRLLAALWASTATATTTTTTTGQDGTLPKVKCVFCDYSCRLGGKTFLDMCVTCQHCDNVTCWCCCLDLEAFFHNQIASREKKSEDESRMNQRMVGLLADVVAAFLSQRFLIERGPCCRILNSNDGQVRFSLLTDKDSLSMYSVTTKVTSDSPPYRRKLICFLQRTAVLNDESLEKPLLKKSLKLPKEKFFCELKRMGKLVDVAADGSCGFHAMLQILLCMGKINCIPSVSSFRQSVQSFGFENSHLIMKDMWDEIDYLPQEKKERKKEARRQSLQRDITSIWREELDYNGCFVSEKQGWFKPEVFVPIIMRMYDIPQMVSYSTSGTFFWNYNLVTSKVKTRTDDELVYVPHAVVALVFHAKHYQVLFLEKQSPVQGDTGGEVVKKRGMSLQSPITTGKKSYTENEQAKSGMASRYVLPVLEPTRFPGIANLGNTCYLGASLQFIFPMRHFLEDLSQLYTQTEDKTVVKLTGAILQVAMSCDAFLYKKELTAIEDPNIMKVLDLMNSLTNNKFPW